MPNPNFESEIWTYYRKNKRDFPWRNTTDPYQILVSEIMLQQTQTGRVVPYYQRFLDEVPTVKALAACPTEKLLLLWKGLGYNRRALQLRDTARQIATHYDGVVPCTSIELQSFPGIGPNTAGAILAYAFNIPEIFIETNIRKTIIHFFFPNEASVSDKTIREKIEEVINKKNPREWYWAVVDYGSMLGKKRIITNKRSLHYKRQSAFEGSNRQKRSLILTRVLAEPLLTIPAIAAKTKIEIGEVKTILSDLANENFIVIIDRRVRIKA